jgi:uncharacterized protein
MNNSRWITQKVHFVSQELLLEGMFYGMSSSHRRPAVVLCHPHPQFGGSMHNNVIEYLCQTLAEAGLLAFKFNFRGVEGSQGCFDEGRGETRDVQSAVDFVLNWPQTDPRSIYLIGYSAGAAWGLKAACENEQMSALVGISPPLEMFNFGFLETCSKSTFLISGSLDSFSPSSRLEHLEAKHPGFIHCEILSGADHFWSGYETVLANRVTDFLKNKIFPLSPSIAKINK